VQGRCSVSIGIAPHFLARGRRSNVLELDRYVPDPLVSPDMLLGLFRDAFASHEAPMTDPRTLLLQITCLWLMYTADTIWRRVQDGAGYWDREN
jgi:hypothetical protein